MRAQFTIAAIGLTCVSAAWACSSGSGTGTQGANNSSSGASSSGSGTSTSSGGSASSSGGSGSSGSSGATSSSGSGGSTSSSGGSSGSTSGSGGSSGGDGGVHPSGDAGLLPYPSGPYCTDVGAANLAMQTGCVIKNLSWMGYVDNAGDALATSKPYVSYSLLDLYNEAHVSGKKYAMINIAEFLCPGCQNSATEMGSATDGGDTAGASIDRAGGILIEVLMTNTGGAPTKANLDSWVDKYNLQFTAMVDLDPSLPTNNTLGRRDQAFIIDLTTMKVLQDITGNIFAAGGANSGPLGMAAMHTLLGK